MPANAPATSSPPPSSPLAAAEELVAAGRLLDAVDLLHRANLSGPDDEQEHRLAQLRHQAFAALVPSSTAPSWPIGADRSGATPAPPRVPRVRATELTGAALRTAIADHGALHVPGLLDPPTVQSFVEGIDVALATREANQATPFRRGSAWFAGLPLPKSAAASLGRPWVAGAGGLLACDSPKLLDRLFATYERIGLRDVLTDYLGERPVLSANKCTLRRVPLAANADWHQDGAFLGSGIRAINVWIALTDCGVDAPGLDVVPRRFSEVQETGTGGAIFDWAVGPETVATLSVEAPVSRPRFQAGDALLFDDLYLHRTAVEPTMTVERYAIESWFFATTDYPEGQVPLVW